MKHSLIFALSVSLAVMACAPIGNVIANNGTALSNAADATVLDEKVGIGAESAYATASTLGRRLAQAGLIDKARFKAADEKAYRALMLMRAAYDAGNAENYLTAAMTVHAAVADIRALVK